MPKNLFEPVTRAGILQRLNALSAASTRQRGKMDAAQTMVHCSVAMQGHRGRSR